MKKDQTGFLRALLLEEKNGGYVFNEKALESLTKESLEEYRKQYRENREANIGGIKNGKVWYEARTEIRQNVNTDEDIEQDNETSKVFQAVISGFPLSQKEKLSFAKNKAYKITRSNIPVPYRNQTLCPRQ